MQKNNEGIVFDKLDENLRELMNVPSYKIGAYTFDVEKRLLKLKGESVKLTKKEAYLLVLFAANVGVVLDRSNILSSIWNDHTHYNSRSMDVYMCKMRKYLSKDSNIFIINIHGRGYRMVID